MAPFWNLPVWLSLLRGLTGCCSFQDHLSCLAHLGLLKHTPELRRSVNAQQHSVFQLLVLSSSSLQNRCSWCHGGLPVGAWISSSLRDLLWSGARVKLYSCQTGLKLPPALQQAVPWRVGFTPLQWMGLACESQPWSGKSCFYCYHIDTLWWTWPSCVL